MSQVMQEAEEVLGAGVSHHKKAWSGTESLFKNSVSRWEEQLSNAQSEIIILENEPEAILPQIKFTKKRTASTSAISPPKAPPSKKARPSLPAHLEEESLSQNLIPDTDDLVNSLVEDPNQPEFASKCNSLLAHLFPNPEDGFSINPPPPHDSAPPSGSAPLPAPLSGPASTLAGTAPLLGDNNGDSMALDTEDGSNTKEMAREMDPASKEMVVDAGKGDGSKAKPAKGKNKQKATEVPIGEVLAKCVSALGMSCFSLLPWTHLALAYDSCFLWPDICKGPISPGDQLQWSQNGALLAPGCTTRPTGKPNTDVGSLVSDMVGCVLQSYQGDSSYLKTLAPGSRLAPENFPPGLLSLPHSADFADMLRAGRLLSLDPA